MTPPPTQPGHHDSAQKCMGCHHLQSSGYAFWCSKENHKCTRGGVPKQRGCFEACHHDYERPVRKGRARYHCPKCGKDISMEVILLAEAEWEAEEQRLRAKHRAGLL